MLRASYFAGCAFTKSYVAMYMQLPILWEDNTMFHMDLPTLYFSLMFWKLTEKQFIRSWQPCCCCRGCLQRNTGRRSRIKLIQAVKDMKARFGIGDTIPEIQEEDIPKLSHYADKEANPLYPVPVLMDAQELEKFYYMLMPAKENTVQ